MSTSHSVESMYARTPEDDDDESWPLPSFTTNSVIDDEQESADQSWPLPRQPLCTPATASLKGSRVSKTISAYAPNVQQWYNHQMPITNQDTTQFFEKRVTSLTATKEIGANPDYDPLIEKSISADTAATPNLLKQWSLLLDDWTPIFLVSLYLIISTSMYIVLPERPVTVMWYTYLTLAFLVSAAVTAEACASNRPARDARRARKKLAETGKFPTPDDLLPTLSLVIVAYLPNEKDIVMQQIRYALREIVYPVEKYSVYLVYNTPKPIEPLETHLVELKEHYSNLSIVKVQTSDSKADNLNYFLENHCQSDIVGIYDTDHYAHPHGPRWAAECFCRGDGTDIVQGRCVVYNYSDTWVSRAISAEFDMIYAVFHPGRAQSHGFGLFGGSNGYWRASLLKELRMQKHMLTEDIDSTLRAFASGAKMVHELNTVSYEQAPTTVAAFYKQRMRWAQGWAQVAIRHASLALRGIQGIKLRSRLGLFFLLVFREAFFYILTQFSCLLLGKLIINPPTHLYSVYDSLFGYPLSAWILVFNCFSLIAITILTIRNRSEFTSPLVIIIYGISMPVYFMILSVMGLMAHARELVKYEKWNATKRQTVVIPVPASALAEV